MASRASRSLHGSNAISPGTAPIAENVANRLMRMTGSAGHNAGQRAPCR
jgi:hypothetical protein